VGQYLEARGLVISIIGDRARRTAGDPVAPALRVKEDRGQRVEGPFSERWNKRSAVSWAYSKNLSSGWVMRVRLPRAS
jgi:hypothetical protein